MVLVFGPLKKTRDTPSRAALLSGAVVAKTCPLSPLP